MLSRKDEKMLDWLSRNALFKSKLQGEVPAIDMQSARKRMMNRILQTDSARLFPIDSASVSESAESSS